MNIKSILITLLALYLCLPALAQDKPLPKDIPALKALAEKGDARAQVQLASKYYFGRGAPKDLRAAAGWYYKAAAQGNVEGQYSMGLMYWRGAGVKKDLAGAYYWLSIAAAGGHKRAIDLKPKLAAELTLAQKAKAEKAVKNWMARQPANAAGEKAYKEGRYADAARLFAAKLAKEEAKPKPDWEELSYYNSYLGLAHGNAGQYDKALEFYQKSLAIMLVKLGKDHPSVARTYNNIAIVHKSKGEYDKALGFYNESLAINLVKRGKDHPSVATTYMNIGNVHRKKAELNKALVFLQKSLAIQLKILPKGHPDLAKSYISIGLVHKFKGEYDKALGFYNESLAINLVKRGKDHPSVATSYLGIGLVHGAKGEYGHALENHQKALAIRLKQLGADHPHVATSYKNIGFAQLGSNNPRLALVAARKARGIEGKRLAYMLSFTSEHERLAYQQTQYPYNLLGTLGSASDLATAVLHNKGIVLASLLEDQLVAQASRDPAIRDLARQLTYSKHVLNKLQLEMPNSREPRVWAQYRARIKTAKAKVEELQQKMARNVAGLGKARRALSIAVRDVQQNLAKDSVLLEIIRYRHYLGKNNWQDRYGAVVLSRDRAPVWVPLGPAKEIESLVRIYHKHLDHKNKSATDIGFEPVLRELHRRLMQPIVKKLPVGTNGLIFSPAGQLNFVSFATLLTGKDRFLCEDYVIEYVSSGRDLIPGGRGGRSSGKVAVFANPDGSLPGTEKEAAFLRSRAKDWKLQPEIYLRERATEVRLTSMASPDILHVTTHGFFWPKSVSRANPMHRSGIILAKPKTGAKPPSENDGTLTAAEASLMKLKGTRIVMLSACQTGQGEVVDGEGVMGLRRAFIQAGTQNLVITLWVIYSGPSVTFMKQFYDRAMPDGSASKALWFAQRDLMVQSRKSGKIQKNDKATLTAVKYFGAFVLSH